MGSGLSKSEGLLHISSDGSDHSFIDQSVTTTSAPTFGITKARLPYATKNTTTTLVVADLTGGIIFSNGGAVLTLPTGENGIYATFIATAAAVIELKPPGSSTITLDGVSLGAGVSLSSDGTIDSAITIIWNGSTYWAYGAKGTWT